MEHRDSRPDGHAAPEDSAQRIKDAAGSVLEHTKQAAADTAERGKSSAASSVEHAASSLRRAADDVYDDSAIVGKTLRSCADGLAKVSQSLRDGDVQQTLGQVNAFARREPALFLGASFALGFALARVGKAAASRSYGEAERTPDLQLGQDAFGG